MEKGNFLMTPTCKGMFHKNLLNFIASIFGQKARQELFEITQTKTEYESLVFYPITDMIRLERAAHEKYFSKHTLENAMIIFGREGFTSFSETMLGKSTLELLSNNYIRLIRNIPTYYDTFTKHFGEIQVEHINDNIIVVRFRDFNNYPEYHFGLIDQALKYLGKKVNLTLKKIISTTIDDDLFINDFDIVFEKATEDSQG
jgi:uncharacterized protein (TIGR02265 family)